MYHSIYFGNNNVWNNTWDDWFLVPKERPSFEPPKRKTRYLDVPGADGSLNLSNQPQGYPLYENRQGSWTFIVVNPMFYEGAGNNIAWFDLVGRIQRYFNGYTYKAFLEDDPEWYYEGTFDVTGYTSGEKYSEITISYNVSPYKWYYVSSAGPKYDPTGTLPGINQDRFKNILIPAGEQVNIFFQDDGIPEDPTTKYLPINNFVGEAPTFPTFKLTGNGEDKVVWMERREINTTVSKSLREVYPSNSTNTKSHAFMLNNRLDFERCWFFINNEFENDATAFTITIDIRKGRL